MTHLRVRGAQEFNARLEQQRKLIDEQSRDLARYAMLMRGVP